KWLDRSSAQTKSGAILGTPSYMAPEQANRSDRQSGPACDVYSVGAILYELLTGRPPFRAETPMDTLVQVVHEEPISPSRLRPGLPRDLETICLTCLQKDPAKRYPSAEALAEDLERFQTGEPIHARPTGRLERVARWCRRNPALATITSAFVLLLVAGVSAVTWKWLEAEYERGPLADEAKAKETARAKADDERRRKEEALELAKTNLYHFGIALSHREWLANHVDTAEERLDACPPERRRWEWRYLKRLCHSELLTLRPASAPTTLAYSPDGPRLATVCDRGVELWDTVTGARIHHFASEAHRLPTLLFAPKGDLLVYACKPGLLGPRLTQLKAWHPVTGKLIYQLSREQ